MITSMLLCSDRAITSNCLLVGSGICISPLQNHVIDPTFFFDAIEEFAFNYRVFVASGITIDDQGKEHINYVTNTIRGSLQSNGSQVNRSLEGNTVNKGYSFYCTSLYRINIGDIIYYQHNAFIVTSVRDYDEWGCRECSVETIQLSQYRDLSDYIKYIEGAKFI